MLQRLAETVQATVLFATHFHELTLMEGSIRGVVNYHVKADVRPLNATCMGSGAAASTGKQGGEQITMLYKLFRGASDRSYGVTIARLCNFPAQIIDEAEQTMAYFEGSSGDGPNRGGDDGEDSRRKKTKLA